MNLMENLISNLNGEGYKGIVSNFSSSMSRLDLKLSSSSTGLRGCGGIVLGE